MKKFLIAMISDDKGIISSKRILGTLCVLSLMFALIISMFSKRTIVPSSELVQAVAWFTFGAFGLTSIEKVFAKELNKE
jgi:hypothetical protein